jgi:hypothetical protein
LHCDIMEETAASFTLRLPAGHCSGKPSMQAFLAQFQQHKMYPA